MKTLYIIHGWAYSVEPWDTTLKILKDNDIKVKMLRVPGLTSQSKKVWTIDEYVNWANDNLPNGAIALGHSNGGRILLNLAAKSPKKLSHLILLDAAGIYEPSKKRDVLKVISKIGAPLKSLPLVSKVYHKLIGANDYEHAPKNMKKTLSNMLDSDKSLHPEVITTKTTILWGENDTVTPPRQAKKLHSLIKNSTLRFFKDWTHAPYRSHPEELAQAIIEILKEGK